MRGRFHLLTALLLLMLPLGGCVSRGDSATAQKPQPDAPSAASPAASAKEPGKEEAQEEPSGTEQATTTAQDTGFYLSGQAQPLASSDEETAYLLRFDTTQEVNFVELPEGAAAPAAVESGGQELYRSPEGCDSCLLRFDTVQTDALTVRFSHAAGEAPPKAGLLPDGTACAAYLPASTPPEALEEYLSSLGRLCRVTVITGLCWDEAGQVVMSDDNYPALLERLCALREQMGFSLFSTLYPARSLIREGRAGEVTKQNREALTASILAHAQAYALDGVDIDWETPLDAAEWESCSGLLTALKAALSEDELQLSAALYPESLERLSPAAVAALDILHLMNYDQFDALGRHATFEGMKRDIARALAAGFLPEQLMAGLPAYGRPLDGAARWPLYREQPFPLTGETVGDSYFNGPQLVRDKAAYCRLMGLQGVFFFHLTADLPADAPFSLLGAVD